MASLLKSHATSGDFIRKSTQAFTKAIKMLLLPYRKGSHPLFTLAFALHEYSHTQKPQITALKRGEDVSTSLGKIVRDALALNKWPLETNDLNDLEPMLLSHANAVRTNVAVPKLQGLFDKRVRCPSGRLFIVGPVWWELLNAGSDFPSWANKYRP